MEERERLARQLCKYHDVDPDKETTPLQRNKKSLGNKVNDGKAYKLWEYWALHYVDVMFAEQCHYCDFLYSSKDEFGKHLNEKHIRCVCGTMFDVGDFDDNLALCKDCR